MFRVFQNSLKKIPSILEVEKISLTDIKTLSFFNNGFLAGVFQIDSFFVRSLIYKLKINNCFDLVLLLLLINKFNNGKKTK